MESNEDETKTVPAASTAPIGPDVAVQPAPANEVRPAPAAVVEPPAEATDNSPSEPTQSPESPSAQPAPKAANAVSATTVPKQPSTAPVGAIITALIIGLALIVVAYLVYQKGS